MLRRAARPTGNLRVVGTGVLRNELTIVDTVNIHLGPAVGAIQQSRQRSRFTPTVGVSADVCSDALHVFKGLLVDHGLVCVFKDAPFAFMDIVAFLVLEVLSCLEVDGMAEVLSLFENTHDDRRTPGIGVFDGLVFVYALAMPRQMDGRNLDFFSREPSGDLVRTVTVHTHGKDPPYHRGSFLIHHPVSAAFIPKIAIDDCSRQVPACLSLSLKGGANLLADITGIPLVHDISERREIIVIAKTVHAVVERNQAHIFLPQGFHHLPYLEVITPQAAHVLDDDRLHIPGLDLRHHGHEAGTIKTGAGYAVIGEMGRAGESIASGIVLQHQLLIANGVGFTLQLIVARQALVQRCDLDFTHCAASFA